MVVVVIVIMVLTLAELGQEIRALDPVLLLSVENTTRCTSGTIFSGKEV